MNPSVSDAQPVAPTVVVLPPEGETTSVVLVLSGGKAKSYAVTDPGQLTAMRMRPFASNLHRRGRRHGLAVWVVRYRYRGWNGRDRSPVADVDWALEEVHRRHGDIPVVLVGHSMGGRTALACGGYPSIKGVCALAPWTEDGDAVSQLTGGTVLIVHGSADMVTSPRASRAFAHRVAQVAARVGYISLPGEIHAMVLRWRTWHSLATGFTMGVLGLTPMPRRIETALSSEV
jgi:alpha-beta hydrolase superfamily lysophospholipase